MLLAVDNALGFAGVEAFAAPVVQVLAVLCVAVGFVAALYAARIREWLGSCVAALLIGFVAAGPYGLPLQLPAVVVTIIQMVLPLGFVMVAWGFRRRLRRTSERFLSLAMLVLAIVWLVGALAPIPLELFLIAQILTVTALVGLLATPVRLWLGAHFRVLWESADIL
ncbi:hypothetical protein [Curtobacterium luteum]|uniref:hypothetical protein n=1 Tax=Curtobacterium luteum TaxID=33881 RepID=UPI00128F42FF|nr:hypothetical protein [Curtobacterium luteum]